MKKFILLFFVSHKRSFWVTTERKNMNHRNMKSKLDKFNFFQQTIFLEYSKITTFKRTKQSKLRIEGLKLLARAASLTILY